MKTAYIYARYSLKIQGMGDSLKRQIQLAEQYAQEQGWPIAETRTDQGVSAYRGRNLEAGALGRFLAEVEAGRIEPGSVLIVESLDRLSRDTLTEQFSLLLTIILNDIELVTLVDRKHFTTATVNANPLELIVSLALMLRAHAESDQKSKRVGAAWARKRQDASRTKLTRKCPPWIIVSKDRTKAELIPDRAESAKSIYRWAAAGLTPQVILERLVSEGHQAWGKDQRWTLTKILDVLNSRAVLGEFQAYRRTGGKAVPDGVPIPGYFPAIVSLEHYALAQQSLRFTRGARQGDKNLFIGLAWDGDTGECVVKRNEYLCNETCDRGGPTHRWAYRAFEQNILTQLEQLDWGAAIESEAGGEPVSQSQRLQARFEDLTLRVERIVEQVCADDSSGEALVKELKRLEREQVELGKKLIALEAAPAERANGSMDTWRGKLDLLARAGDGHPESRLLLRQQLRLLIERIDLWPVGGPEDITTKCYSVMRAAIVSSGFDMREDPRTLPCYRITFRNGKEHWVICARSRLLMNDLRVRRCEHNAAIAIKEGLMQPNFRPQDKQPRNAA